MGWTIGRRRDAPTPAVCGAAQGTLALIVTVVAYETWHSSYRSPHLWGMGGTDGLVLTTIGLQFGSLLGQGVVVEKLFAWPGVGSLLVDSVFQRDIPAVQGCILVITLFFLVINTSVDIAYKLIDPRIRYT